MKAKEIMHTDVLRLDATTSAYEAARRMAGQRHGYAILLKEGKPTSIVTEWDFLERVVAAGVDPRSVPVEAIASAPIRSVDEGETVADVVETMAANGIRRMPVTREGEIVGVITTKDVVATFRRYVDRLSSDIARLHAPPP